MDLRFIARESDWLMVETADGEKFRLLIDDQLKDAIRGNRQVSESGVSPREVQTRLRSGEDLEDIAAHFGVPVSAIEPFAAPILDELNYVIAAALATKVTDGDHMISLGELIERESPGASFKAKRDGDSWLITASGPKTLLWSYDPKNKSVEPKNSVATDVAKLHANRDIVTATIPIVKEEEDSESDSASVLDLVEELRARRKQPEPIKPATAKGRASLPSWDEIVLGTNQNSESESN